MARLAVIGPAQSLFYAGGSGPQAWSGTRPPVDEQGEEVSGEIGRNGFGSIPQNPNRTPGGRAGGIGGNVRVAQAPGTCGIIRLALTIPYTRINC